MQDEPIKLISLLTRATAPVVGDSKNTIYGTVDERTFQASIAGVGAVSATVVVEVSNDDVQFITLATINLTGTNMATDSFTSTARWVFLRARLTAISGTGAVVNCTAGV